MLRAAVIVLLIALLLSHAQAEGRIVTPTPECRPTLEDAKAYVSWLSRKTGQDLPPALGGRA
jgi:hypothetical protein